MTSFKSTLRQDFFGRDWCDVWDFPSRLTDQHFGLGLLWDDDLLLRPALHHSCYLRPKLNSLQRSASGISDVKNTKDKFQVMLDVGHFKPDELSVKIVENRVVINGKHPERHDQHGGISREFTRSYILPKDVETEKVISSLSSDGYLTVEAPKRNTSLPKPNERIVPIAMTNDDSVDDNMDSKKDSHENGPEK